MLEEIVTRIEKRLAALEMSAGGASKAAGLSADAIRNMKRGVTKSVNVDTIAALARVLETTVSWLLEGTGEERDSSARRFVPLVGYVGAGAQAHFYSDADEGLGEVEAPEGANEYTRAAEIRGTSLGPLFERWLIFYDDVHDPVTADQIGKLCIVGLKDGKVLVKKIKRSRAEGFYHLESNVEETMYDQEVLWAARVRQMTPR